MSFMSRLADRMVKDGTNRPQPSTGPGSGAMSNFPIIQPWRGTSVQVCGLYPLGIGAPPPTIGVPLGPSVDGHGFLCADHIEWFQRGLISAPSAMVLALNGLGKSTLVRRIILGHAHNGINTVVLGDIKPDYVDLIRALGGQVITIGHGVGGINPLDAGNVDQALERMKAHRPEQRRLLRSAHERKKNMILTLMHIQRHRYPDDREQAVIDEAIHLLEGGGGKPALPDLLALVREAPDRLREVALSRGSMSRYQQVTEELEITLQALLRGRMGKIFSERHTTPMLMDRSVVFDVSPLNRENEDEELQAAVLLSCWSYGFATVEISQSLADVGVAPRRYYSLIMDELWRALQVSSGMVQRINSLTRLNRTVGVGQMMITHSMGDFKTLSTEADRNMARSFVERSKMRFLGGFPTEEMTRLESVMQLSQAEKDRLTGWADQGSYDPYTQSARPPSGMGRFMLKISAAPGYTFMLNLTPGEMALSEGSNSRWDRQRLAQQGAER